MAEPRRVFVHAAAALGPFGDLQGVERRALTAAEPLFDPGPLVRELRGRSLRQASRFSELAVAGALACARRLARGEAPASDVPVYLGTGLGEVAKTGALFDQVMPPTDGLPSPYDFIHSASNMAAFHVAQAFGLTTRNLTLSEGTTSFEAVLELAWREIAAGEREAVLVGGVDERCTREDPHLPRMPLAPGEVGGEGSSWLWLASRPQGAVGSIDFVRRIRVDRRSTPSRLAELAADLDGCDRLLPGVRVDLEAATELALGLGLPGPSPYLARCGVSPTASAFGLAELFDDPADEPLRAVHVAATTRGEQVLVGLRIQPSAARSRR